MSHARFDMGSTWVRAWVRQNGSTPKKGGSTPVRQHPASLRVMKHPRDRLIQLLVVLPSGGHDDESCRHRVVQMPLYGPLADLVILRHLACRRWDGRLA